MNDYGTFTRYTPDPLPDWMGEVEAEVDFLRNEAGTDLYDLKRTLGGGAPQTYLYIRGGLVAGTLNDVTGIWPENARLIGLPLDENHAALRGKVLEADGSFSDPPPPPIRSVGPAQGRIALRRAGLRAQVEQIVAAAPDSDLADWWGYATTWERDSANIAAMAGALGLSEAQVDALFATAAGIAA